MAKIEQWIKDMPKLKGISKKMLQALYERSIEDDERNEDYKINKEKEKMKLSTNVDDIAQCHDMMRTTYSKRIGRKYSKIQGIDILKYSDLNAEGQKEIDELYNNYPTDAKSIKEIIRKRENSND